MSDKLIIFDTTCATASKSARRVDDQGREAAHRSPARAPEGRRDRGGFAASSNGDFEAVRAMQHAIKDSTVCSLARAERPRHLARRRGAAGRASTRITCSSRQARLHMEKKLRMTPDQVFEQARLSTRFARNLSSDVEFSGPKTGYRSDPDFLCRVLEA
jgi:2-isopropylmalate synthase